ncbi:MAG: DNA polymerase I [Myxococcales bacterium]|nr:DNA polymerase I [Myxococcales bacterium]
MKNAIQKKLVQGADAPLYIIDVSHFIFRAYYSVGHLSTRDGQPVGAVFGVANMLVSLFNEMQPQHVVIAMDSRTPTFRKTLYPAYKANRPPVPEDLKAQISLVTELVDAFDLAVLQCDGFEADDIIATATKAAVARDMGVVIVSADKDLMQLVDDRVVMLDTLKKKVWDSDAIAEKWGVPPALLGDLLALAGDSSDNIPGVPRIGPKTAAPLLAQHGSLTALLAAAPTLKTKAAERLVDFADDARLSRQLVALKDDVPIAVDIDALRYDGPRAERLLPLLEQLEFHQLKTRLFGDIPGAPNTDTAAPAPPDVTYRALHTLEEVRAVIAKAHEQKCVAIDLETTSVDPMRAEIVGVALSYQALEGVYIPIAQPQQDPQGPNLPLGDVLEALRPLLTDAQVAVVIQNLKYEDIIFQRHGIHIANIHMDPMLASYLLRAGERTHGLDVLAQTLLHRKTRTYDEVTEKQRGHQLLFQEVSLEAATEYAAEDAEITLALSQHMEGALREADMLSLLHDVEIPLARVLTRMEMTGVSVDVPLLQEMSARFAVELEEITARAHDAAGREFNLASPKQLQEILFTELKLPPSKKTQTGWSTDVAVLQELSFLHELPGLLLQHRELSKLKNTYLDALPALVHPETGRIHTSYNQAVTATGRLSSSSPNLQNIPIRSERGREIRRAFVAQGDMRLLSADYSQIELRILAHLSNDPALMAAYTQGVDIHERTARAIYGIPDDAPVSRDQRAAAKTVNFGVIYGKTGFSLAKELGISRAQGQHFIDTYFSLYHGVADYMERTVAQARVDRAAFSLLGRRRELRDIASPNFNIRQAAERMARNMPIQATAADLLKLAMIRVDRALRENGLSARMILTVHDELVFEVPATQIDATREIAVAQMEGAMSLSVPLQVETGEGANWADAH